MDKKYVFGLLLGSRIYERNVDGLLNGACEQKPIRAMHLIIHSACFANIHVRDEIMILCSFREQKLLSWSWQEVANGHSCTTEPQPSFVRTDQPPQSQS